MTAPALKVARQLSDEARCRHRRWSGELLCSMPGVLLLTAGCVHEHVAEERYCDAHARALLDGDLTLACVQCRRSTQPHNNCAVRVIASERVA